jgi:hypothetical protein
MIQDENATIAIRKFGMHDSSGLEIESRSKKQGFETGFVVRAWSFNFVIYLR